VAEEDGRLHLRLLRSLSQTKEFRQAQLVGIAGWAVTVGLNPFRMLNAQILVNLSLKFGVGMNFVRHGNSSVIGSTEDGRIGTAEKEIKAFQPFFVELDPPRVALSGERP